LAPAGRYRRFCRRVGRHLRDASRLLLQQIERHGKQDDRSRSRRRPRNGERALHGVLRLASERSDAPVGLLALAGHPRLAPTLRALFNEPARAWSLPELARLCNMSRATLARQIQEKLAPCASDLLTDIRMTLVANELRKSSMSTGAVTEAVGYQSEDRIPARVHCAIPAKSEQCSNRRHTLAGLTCRSGSFAPTVGPNSISEEYARVLARLNLHRFQLQVHNEL
jgi:AraC-like DNA-binding protein